MNLLNNKETPVKSTNIKVDISGEIIDDCALVDCINTLNLLRRENISSVRKDNQADEDILQLGAELHWVSQWMSIKGRSWAKR